MIITFHLGEKNVSPFQHHCFYQCIHRQQGEKNTVTYWPSIPIYTERVIGNCMDLVSMHKNLNCFALTNNHANILFIVEKTCYILIGIGSIGRGLYIIATYIEKPFLVNVNASQDQGKMNSLW